MLFGKLTRPTGVGWVSDPNIDLIYKAGVVQDEVGGRRATLLPVAVLPMFPVSLDMAELSIVVDAAGNGQRNPRTQVAVNG